MKYIVQCRYQYRHCDGVRWSKWFTYDSNDYSESEVKNIISEYYNNVAKEDKITKLKHEFRQYSFDQYNKDYKSLIKEVDRRKVDFASIKPMKKIWLKESRKERKKLQQMNNAEKVLYLVKKRENS